MDSTRSLQDRLEETLITSATLAPAPWLFVPVVRMLARGVPVTVQEVAVATGTDTRTVQQAIEAGGDIELDDQGRIVGYGLTLRPTRHRFEVTGKPLYTWCALDTLMFPALLGQSAVVESPSPLSATPVRVLVGPDGVHGVDPAEAVVSLVTTSAPSSVRASFCDHVHFFASAAEGRAWVAQHPDATIVPVQEAFRLGRALVRQLVTTPSAGSPLRSSPAHECC